MLITIINKKIDKYSSRRFILRLVLFLMDSLLSLFFCKKKTVNYVAPKRILLVNGGHLGDVVIATSVIPIVRSAYPNAKIGFVVGSWSKCVIKNNSMIDYIHCVDHWKLNRYAIPFWKKLKNYIVTRNSALDEIRQNDYDIVVDLYSCFPNLISLLYQSQIPIRIGYISAGFGPLLTHGYRVSDTKKHESIIQSDLLRELPIGKIHFLNQWSILPEPSAEAFVEVQNVLKISSFSEIKYRIIHIGAGATIREWSLTSWRQLVEKLSRQGYRLLFTGVSNRERHNIETLIFGLNNCINACGKLTWQALVATIQKAQLLYCVDTVVGHISAAVKTPCVVIATGIVDSNRWRPMGDRCKVVTNALSCAPCFRKRGCDGMECINKIKVSDVYDAGEEIVRRCSF